MTIKRIINAENMNEAVKTAMVLDKTNSEYTNSVTFETTTEMDENIYSSAIEKQQNLMNGDEKYRVLSNNCADMVEDIIEKGIHIDIPTGLSPTPNSSFKVIMENKDKIQLDINKQKNNR